MALIILSSSSVPDDSARFVSLRLLDRPTKVAVVGPGRKGFAGSAVSSLVATFNLS